MLDLNTRQVPVVEDPCEVSSVQGIYCSPRLSPITPESGTDSFSTAKTHSSSYNSTPPLPPRTNTRVAKGNLSPHGDPSHMVGLIIACLSVDIFNVKLKDVFLSSFSVCLYLVTLDIVNLRRPPLAWIRRPPLAWITYGPATPTQPTAAKFPSLLCTLREVLQNLSSVSLSLTVITRLSHYHHRFAAENTP